MNDRQRWLGLAARHRRWQVEERLPELARRVADERRAEDARAAAEDRLAHAHRERAELLAGTGFAADQLSRHVDFAAHARAAATAAEAEAARTRDEAGALRTQAQALLAERDAYVERLERLQATARQDAARRETREHDERWLAHPLRAAASREESGRED